MAAPAPPKGLDAGAKKLWRATQKRLQAERRWDDSLRPLVDAYALAEMQSRLAGAGAGKQLTAVGSTGQLVEHPALKIARRARAEMQGLARELRLMQSPAEATSTTLTERQQAIEKRLPKLKWCYRDFKWFWGQVAHELPSGKRGKLEPFWVFILKFIFRTGLVELLVLLPKGNGKSTVLAALAIFHVLVTKNAEAFVVAGDGEQSEELFRFAQHYVEHDQLLEPWLKVAESTLVIRSKRDNGFFRVIRTDQSRQKGRRHSWNPTFVICEEMHAYEDAAAAAAEALSAAAFKRGAVVLGISTAGWREDSKLGKVRQGFFDYESRGGVVARGLKINARAEAVEHKDGRLTIASSPSGGRVMLEWACRDEDDILNPRVVKLANPASYVTVKSIADALEDPDFKLWNFARYRANRWTLSFESWLEEGAWERLAVGRFDAAPYDQVTKRRRVCIEAPPALDVDLDSDVFCSIDMARYRDSAAITVVSPDAAGRDPAVWLAFVEYSGGRKSPIDYEPVKQALRDLDDAYRVLAIGWDPKYFDEAAQELDDEGLPMVQFDQGNDRMCPAWDELHKRITRGRLRHDGDPVLEAHVLAGHRRDVGDKEFKVVKSSKNGPVIDACVSLAMSNRLAFHRPQKSNPFVEVVTG
jgi:phage terminase large subunit-like protein